MLTNQESDMQTRFVLAFSISTMLLTGCGDGDSDSGGSGSGAVSFRLDRTTGPTCFNTDDTNHFSSGDYQSIDCYWYCAPFFDGKIDVYVSIDFEKSNRTGGIWIKDSTYTSEGIC